MNKTFLVGAIGLLYTVSPIMPAQADIPLPATKPAFLTKTEDVKVPVTPLETDLKTVIDKTLQTNPDVMSAAKTVDLAREDIDLARSNYRPNVSANAGINHVQSDTDLQSEWEGNTAKTIGLAVVQPLYRGGRTTAEVSEKESLATASTFYFSGDIQNIIISTVEAYMRVFRAREALEVNANNQTLLTERYKATKAGFEVGELTKTDVSQAEARMAAAKADYIAAEAALDVAVSNYTKVTGMTDVGNLSYPVLDQTVIPSTLDMALDMADRHNPVLRGAAETLKAQEYNIEEQEGAFLPEVNLGASLDAERDPAGGLYDRRDSASLSVNATLPLYQSGVIRNRLRQAKITKSKAEFDLESTRRQIMDNVIAAWQDYKSTATQITAREAQVKAAHIAYEGVTIEQQAGARSILDVLDINQDVKDAELSLIEAQSNAVIAYYRLLAATGQLGGSFWDNSKTPL